MLEKIQLNMMLLQNACQRLDLHADLKAFRQSVFKKVYKEHKAPKEKQKAAKAGRAGEAPTYQSQGFSAQATRQQCSVLLVTTLAVLAGPSFAAGKGRPTAVKQ